MQIPGCRGIRGSENANDHFVTRTIHSSTLPSTVAVMVVVPAETAFTTPLPETVAIPVFLDAQVTDDVVPLTFSCTSGSPTWVVKSVLLSLGAELEGVVVVCPLLVPPFPRTMQVPLPLPSVTVMVAWPAETADTLPSASTVAMFSSLLLQV